MTEEQKKKHPKLAAFIEKVKEKAPELGNTIGAVLPEKGWLGVVKNIITNHPNLSPEDKLEFMKMETELLKDEGQQVTARHAADMASDSWMSKNVRPITLFYLLFLFTVLVIIDSCNTGFDVSPEYIDLMKAMLLLIFGFYFGGRSLEKIMNIFTKRKS